MRSRPLPHAPNAPPAVPDGADATSTRPSKTERKNASHALQALGAALLEMSDERIASLGLDEPLLDALRAYRRMRSHEAKRRQMQLIGKLMRSADVEPVRRAVAEAELGRASDSLALHKAEQWRAELIAADAAATRFADDHPGADLQRLRSLVRGARKDQAVTPEARSGRAYRELFRFIREHEHDGA